MTGVILLLCVPLLVGGLSFLHFRHTISVKEFALQLTLSVVLAVTGWMLARWQSMRSVEHWNGRIISKDSGTESCCHCRTVCDARDKDGKCTSSHEECEHSYDNWWSVDVSTGDTLKDDCNGSGSAPRWWADAYVGEPASVPHDYTNYLKADPESLLHRSANPADLDTVPPFPEIHDYDKVSKVVTHGGASAPQPWQRELMEINANLGDLRQVDVTVVLTTRPDPEYAYAIEAKWLYGPKNALIVVMGTDLETITWARVVTISDVDELAITLRDELPGRSLHDPTLIQFIGQQVEAKFHRKPMADFEYLASAAAPRGWWLVGLYALVLLVSIGLTMIMHAKDVFGDERFASLRRLRRR
jgi:hypothetical protein